MIEEVNLFGTLDANGTLVMQQNRAAPMRLARVRWIDANLADGVDAVLEELVPAPAGATLNITDTRVLLTLTDANNDAWYEVDQVVDGAIRLTITNGGAGAMGGCIAYFDDELETAASGGATSANQTTGNASLAAIEAAIKAEDAVHASGDKGIMALAVRKDTPVAVAADGDYHPVTVDGTGRVWTHVDSITPPATFFHGQMTVTTAGTELVLASSQVLVSGVTIKALHGNTGWIYVGKNPVTLSTGFVLDAGESIFIETDNLADVYIDCSVNGEGVSYLAS